MSSPSNLELDSIAQHLFLFRPDSETRLTPLNHDASTEALLGILARSPITKDLAFAIVLHPRSDSPSASRPRVYLQNSDDNWDIGSAGKLSLPIAAYVLRRDVQTLVAAGLVNASTSPERLDALFRYVWRRHSSPSIRALALDNQWPRPSRVLDWSGARVVLQGGLPKDADAWLELDRRAGTKHISAGDFPRTSFTEFVLLTLQRSDNVAARVCQGALGVGFADAVIEKLGLFLPLDPWQPWAEGSGLRVAGLYGAKSMPKLPRGWPEPKAVPTRKVRAFPPLIIPRHIANPPERSFVGTARSMGTLITAIMTDRFLDADSSAAFRGVLMAKFGFATLTHVMLAILHVDQSLRRDRGDTSFFYKIGAFAQSRCHFLHVKLTDSQSRTEQQYSVVVLGLSESIVKLGGDSWPPIEREEEILSRLHRSIVTDTP